MIGDTDFFIDLMHPRLTHHARALAKAEELEATGVRVAMTAMTRFELAAGAEQSVDSLDERRRVLELIREYTTYGFDGPTADRAGALFGSLRARGDPLEALDVMIAAIALERREPLLTRNRRHFARVEGLVLESY